ncbi:MAG: zf-HC2 domain-containing protein [Acidobacteriia bacterium]|nr:zf-HC2 domain-containing protein [Terriglobia bacterium]
MDCREYQLLISAQIDGDMSPAEVLEAERHLGACSRCAAVYNDLKTIVVGAQQLPPFEPSDRLWIRVQAQCEADGLVRQSPGAPWLRMEWFRLLEGPRIAMATAFLAVLIMVASVMTYRGIHTPPQGPSRDSTAEIQAANEVRTAEQHYLDAIDSLQRITESRMAQMDPSLKSILEDNLATIDYYIDKCRESVKNDPSNALAQRYLLEAYRKKVDLLASIVHSDVF